MFLIFDTETTGRPRNYNAPLSDFDNWPRMVQIAWQLHDLNGNLLDHRSVIIKPEGYTIPFNAVQIHGITNERAAEEGEELKLSLIRFAEVVNQTNYLCGHNIEFDINIIGAEFLRCGLPNIFEGKQIIDTKNDDTTAFCAIPGGKGGKFKWPTLSELYTKLFNSSFAEAHNAAFDVAATGKVFFEIIKRKITKVKEIGEDAISLIQYQEPDLSDLYKHEQKWKERKSANENQKNIVADKSNAAVINASGFSHLHNHSQFSVLQSTTDVAELVKKAAEFNSKGIAITDHGNMYGAFLFWQSVDKQNKNIKAHNEAIEKGEKTGEKKNELKCIIGCELYVCKNRKDRSKQDNGYAIPVLAKNKNGYENLCKLSSEGFTEGNSYEPRIDQVFLLH